MPFWYPYPPLKKWFFLAYNADTGLLHLDLLTDDGRSFKTVWSGDWDPGWTRFMPFYVWVAVDMGTYTKYPAFLAYYGSTGVVHFDAPNPNLADVIQYGLLDSLVVCSACSPELLAAKTRGILDAMARLIAFCGADALPRYCPVTFHLDAGGPCEPYAQGMTGRADVDSSGHGYVCLWDVEKVNRFPPFSLENAEGIQDQLLPVHEAMHIWFTGRQENYFVQEPFCKLVSFVVSEYSGGPDYSTYFANPDESSYLMKYLYEIGMNRQSGAETLKRLAQSAEKLGRALTDAEFSQVVSDVLGQDTAQAFHKAGIYW